MQISTERCFITANRVLLVVIVVVGCVLRCDQIKQPLVDAFSWRQASTAMMASNFYHDNWNIFLPQVDWSGPGPSYQGREFQLVTFLTALLYLPLGEHACLGRVVSVLFSLFGIASLYLLLARLYGARLALMGAGILAVLPGNVFIGRSFLPDPAMVAIGTFSLWLIIRSLETRNDKSLVLGHALIALAITIKPPGVILLFPVCYVWFEHLKTRQVGFAHRVLCFAVVVIPVILFYSWAYYVIVRFPPHHFPGGGNWLWDNGLQSLVDEQLYLPKLSKIVRQWLIGETALVLSAVGFLLILRWRPRSGSTRTPYPWLFHWWVIGFIAMYLVGAGEFVENPWNLNVITPAVAAFGSFAIAGIIRGLYSKVAGTGYPRLARTVSVVFVVVVTGAIYLCERESLSWMYVAYAGEGRAMGIALKAVSEKNDLVLTMANSLGDPVAIYYAKRRGWVFPPASEDGDFVLMPEDWRVARARLDDLRRQGARWLAITSNQRKELVERLPEFVAHIENNANIVLDRGFVIYKLR